MRIIHSIFVLILFTGNSCRSQIAVEVMKEYRIDISGQELEKVDKYREQQFDLVITVCDNAHEACPFFASAGKMLHKSFLDPAKSTRRNEEIMNEFRKVRDEIKSYAERILKGENRI